ncbi:hypothetical protein A3B56_01370 [Candidatus Roizmanbacteria bacterium RIFCSPLOWO2_01_FULL_45_11]|uniref:Transcriptional regulator MraZ n=1 Tax=Candidatus Roizmanbacteria bacterium RIFCSPLOWO2_01_FULL_45_11 TaxID=1802070 RepID=A0A1F7JIG0_9BACT|nr:MAG: hypothetical protein A3B56_01370 [Candidatus Roizmanbacteria bacterium RIFCSPLOWO2_01_FULL_45_11]
MLLGTYEPGYAGTGRIALPKKIRDELSGNRIVITTGFENCLTGFDEKTWNDVVLPELERPFFSDEEARRMRRKMCVNAVIVQIDSQGRIVMPETMLAYARIVKLVTVIGAGDHFEIWDKAAWSEYAKGL